MRGGRGSGAWGGWGGGWTDPSEGWGGASEVWRRGRRTVVTVVRSLLMVLTEWTMFRFVPSRSFRTVLWQTARETERVCVCERARACVCVCVCVCV